MKLPSASLYIIVLCMLFFITVSARASGSIEKSERDVSGFNAVSFETAGRLILIQGDEEYMTIEAPSKVIRRITARVRRQTLHIGYRGIFTARKAEPVITLGVKDICRLSASGAGEIEAEGISAESLEMEISSSGGIAITSLEAGTGKILIGSSGNLSIGNGRLSSLDVKISSSGNLSISGEARHLNLKCSSSGSFEGEDFKVSSASAELSSSGDAAMWVADSLEARLSNKGELAYYGEPQLKLSSSSTQGRIRAMGNR